MTTPKLCDICQKEIQPTDQAQEVLLIDSRFPFTVHVKCAEEETPEQQAARMQKKRDEAKAAGQAVHPSPLAGH